MALLTTDGPGVTEQLDKETRTVDRQPAIPMELDDSNFVSIHVDEDVLSLIPSERDLSPAPKKKKSISQEKVKLTPVKAPISDLPRIPRKKQSDSPRYTDKQDTASENTRYSDRHSSHHREYRNTYRSDSDRFHSPSRRRSPASTSRKTFSEPSRDTSPGRS